MKRSIFKIILAIIILAVLVLVGAFYIYRGLSLRQINVSLNVPTADQQIGVPFVVGVTVTNDSNSALNNVRVTTALPAGLVLAGNHNERVIEDDMSQLQAGASFNRTYTLIAVPVSSYNAENLVSTVYYSPQSITAVFNKSTTVAVNVANPNFTLNLTTATTTVFSGENFSLTAAYANNGTSTVSDLKLEFDYPSGYAPISANPTTTSSQPVWDLGQVPNGGGGQVTVTGQASLPDNSNFPMAASLVGTVDGQDYVLTSQTVNMTIAQSPLSLSISLNGGDPNQTIYPGETLNYVLTYANNTPSTFSNINLKAQVLGSMLNWGTLQTNGSFSGYNNTITWSHTTLSQLSSLGANASGTVSFSVSLDSSYPIRYLNDKDFTVTVKAQASSPTVPYLINAGQTQTLAMSEAKVAGQIAVKSAGYFRDAASGIVNTGPWPPKVGQATEYSIHWSVVNYATDVSNLTVQAQLPPGVTFVGAAQNNSSSTLVYDQSTNSVVWQIGNLPATTGLLTTPPQVVFQVSATPQASDAGNYMTILGETDASATDAFAGGTLTASSSPITTLLPSDPTVSVGQGIVQQ